MTASVLATFALLRHSLLLGAGHAVAARGMGVDPCRDMATDPEKGEPKSVTAGELVLVTGGSGFIGSHLVTNLLRLGYTVRVYDNLETGNILYLDLCAHPGALEFVHGDIINRTTLRTAMEGVRLVVHFGAASKVLPSLKNPRMATYNTEQNAIGTANVLELAKATGLVRKVVYAASSTYYGNQRVPFHEDDPFVPSSPYAASKYMGELQMSTYDKVFDLPTLSLRFFMVYGPRNPSSGAYAIVTGKFIERMRANEPLLIEGSGDSFRDFVHADDVARACILGLQSSVRGVAINVGSGEAHSIKEVADLVSTNQRHVAPRPNDLLGTLADTCRARELLHFSSRYRFLEELPKLIALAMAGDESLGAMWAQHRTTASTPLQGVRFGCQVTAETCGPWDIFRGIDGMHLARGSPRPSSATSRIGVLWAQWKEDWQSGLCWWSGHAFFRNSSAIALRTLLALGSPSSEAVAVARAWRNVL